MTDTTTVIKITAELIDALNPCSYSYRNHFVQLFPAEDERYADGLEVTPEVTAAHADHFDLTWLARAAFTDEAYRKYYDVIEGHGDAHDKLNDEETELRNEHTEALEAWRATHGRYDPDFDTSDEARDEYRALRRAFNDQLEVVRQRRRTIAPTVFAELWADPTNYTDRLWEAESAAARTRVARDERRLEHAEQQIAGIQERIRHWTDEPARKIVYWTEEPPRQLAALASELEATESSIVELRVVVAGRRRDAARRELADLETRAKIARDAADLAATTLADAEAAVEAARATSDAPVAS